MRKHTDMAKDICNEVLGRIKTTCEGSKGFPAPLDVRSLLNSSAIKGLGKAETKKRRQALARILYKLVQMGFLEGVDKGTGESVQDIVDLAIVDKQTKLANPDKYEYDIPRNLGKVLNDRDHFDLISQIIVGDVDLDFFGKYVERLEKEALTYEERPTLGYTLSTPLAAAMERAMLDIKRSDALFVYDIFAKAFRELVRLR